VSLRNDIDRIEELARILASRSTAAAKVGAGSPLVSATLVGQIYVDPQNISGAASDISPPTLVPSGQVISGPVFRTYRGVTNAWGTVAPLLRSSTTIVFLSSHTDNTDPVVFRPIVANGAQVIVMGASPKIVASSTLSGTIPKNRAAGSNSLLKSNLGASGTAGQMVENITRSSRAWVYAPLGGNLFELSQPMAKASIPVSLSPPAEIDTWADGDNVNLLQPVSVNIVVSTPTIADLGSAFTGSCFLFQLNAFNPGTLENADISQTRMLECSSDRNVHGQAPTANVFTNCYLGHGVLFVSNAASASAVFFGGVLAGSTGMVGGIYDGDVILGTSFHIWGGTSQFGFVFLDGIISKYSGMMQFINSSYGGHVIYGRAGKNINISGSSHGTVSGTFASSFTAPDLVSVGIQLNGVSTGHSVVSGTPDASYGGIVTTVANLDAPAGAAGFGGTAFNPGGASISNQL
jgi:hypothetical protein